MQTFIGDIGGTNTRLALYEDGIVVARRTLPSHPDQDIVAEMQAFLRAQEAHVAASCLAVAGPVRNGKVRLTNLGWSLDEADIAKMTGAPAKLINDFAAVAYAIPALQPQDVVDLGGDGDYPDLPIAVIGAGTGLGEAIVVPQPGGAPLVLPTEGGHSAFAPTDAFEDSLLDNLRARYDQFVCAEHVLGGSGLVAIYDLILLLEGVNERHPQVEREGAAAVSRLALEGACPFCEAALERYTAIYGAEASNLVMKCWGGAVYIAGNIAIRNLPFLKKGFKKSFVAKGVYREWLETLPIRVIVKEDTGLFGASVVAASMASA